MLEDSARVKIVRLKPRFGFDKKSKGLNDLTVNFVYNGQMVCELQIKLILKMDKGELLQPLLYSNHFVYEVQRCCEYRKGDWDKNEEGLKESSRYKLFDVYSQSLEYYTKHKLTIDSELSWENNE